ncbi:uncharacterized protein Z519_09602 [Cladophialophora bantiana CBS 173.52]|uniref:Isochorismatase-like domain-containing protein n=1 Tax=Cladophialophora bantiana (strain ATCC 10958 / CBS 173.52 / CDC B-1940 / NIH 8579) TaxID=1442370 RepID=A0A0D2EHC5_CLAB1|nr:uncharacterized protein Z519_09602 [Cladophialophora bantiana CBS 173.52]KIW89446.1 hypothetical protein Z519_09602 [Cladophialophora bantiana CBS 173.52]
MSLPSTNANPLGAYLSPASGTRTALLLIDIQRGLNTSNGYFGTERSTPDFEENIISLLAACREYNKTSTGTSESRDSKPTSSQDTAANGDTPSNEADESSRGPFPIEIVHVYHSSTNPLSPLHASGTTQKDGILFMPCAAPVSPSSSGQIEHVLSKSTNTAFGNVALQPILERSHIAQLVVVGIATDHCVSTSVRWAKDLGVVKGQGPQKEGKQGKIVIVSDATACFSKGGFDAETVQKVHLASLEGEFAKVMSTSDVLAQLFG